MTKKFLMIVFILSIFFSAIIMSCSKDAEEAGPKTIKIVIAGGQTNNSVRDWLQSSFEVFKETHPNVSLDLQILSASSGEYYSKVALMLPSDSSIDIVAEDSFILKADVAAGNLAPLNVDDWSDWDTQYSDAVKTGVSVDGKVYSIPYSSDVRGIYYNIELFKKAGLPENWAPKTWDDLLDAARAIKKSSASDVIPFFLYSSKATGERTTMQGGQMLLYGTNDQMKENGKWVVRSQGLLDTLRMYQTIYKEELGPPVDIALDGHNREIIFEQYATADKLGFAIDGNWIPNIWIKAGWDEWNSHYKYIPMPTKDGQAPGAVSMSGGWGLSINSISKNKDLAWDFIKFANKKENVLGYSKAELNMSVRKDVGEDPSYKNIGVFGTASSFLSHTHFRPANEDYPAISTEFQVAIESVSTQTKTPEKAMEEYAQRVIALVGEDQVVSKNYQ